MASESVEKFLKSTTAERLRIIKNGETNSDIRSYLGNTTLAGYISLLESFDESSHLAEKPDANLVFVPGVMGSLLTSKGLGGMWWIDARSRNHIDDLEIAPGGLEDIDGKFGIEAFNVDLTYEPFQLFLHNRDDFNHIVFPFDWRKHFSASTLKLSDLIQNTFEMNGNKPVHLVGHSMGGLMIRAMLMEFGDKEFWKKIGKVVFIGTPHYGSPSIAGYLKNHLWGFELLALLGLYLSRKTFRSLAGVVSMLPAPVGIYPGTSGFGSDPASHPCANYDLYDVDQWELELDTAERGLLADLLGQVKEFHNGLFEYHQGLDQEFRDRMLAIVGVGYKTLFRLEKHENFLWDSTVKVTTRSFGDENREGDSRVPVASAKLGHVNTRYVKGRHGDLPNIPAVYSDVVRFLKNEPLTLPTSVEDALSSHLAVDKDMIRGFGAPEPSNIDSSIHPTAPSDPSELEIFDSNSAQSDLSSLEALLAKDQLPDFNRIKIL